MAIELTDNGSQMKFNKKVLLHFNVATLAWTFPFLVSEVVSGPVMIGMDFIVFSGVAINVAQRKISFLLICH